MQKKKILKPNLLVIVDDMNLPFGKSRLRGKGSDGGHNGLKDINQIIGSDYARLRLGIGNAPKGQHVDFVLGPWSDDERAELPAIFDMAMKVVMSFSTAGIGRTMTQFNQD
jgi:PTH1 family peptidyl-tRNA hydrolase